MITTRTQRTSTSATDGSDHGSDAGLVRRVLDVEISAAVPVHQGQRSDLDHVIGGEPLQRGPVLFGGAGLTAPAFMPRAGSGVQAAAPAAAGGAVNVNFNVSATDARSFIGAEAEVSAMLLRAVRRGTRAS